MIPIPGFSPTMWIAAGAGLLIVALGAGIKIQTARLDTCKTKHTAFVAKVEAIGEAQEAIAKAKDAENQKAKERADEQNRKAKRDIAGLYDAYSKLRDQSARRSDLPPASPTAASPADITFDRAALDRGLAIADGILQGGAAKILRRGDEAIVDLDSVKAWAQEPAR